jgi:hypothetical protein
MERLRSISLNIYSANKKIGEMSIGRGSLMWWGPNRVKGKRIDWGKFAKIMDELP